MTGPLDPGDRGLRRAFDELRRTDAQDAPSYDDVMARERLPGRRDGQAPLWGSALAAGVVLAALVAVRGGRLPAPSPAAPAIETWTAPTDFLLETPGRDVLETVPFFGQRPSPLAQEPASLGPKGRRAKP